MESLDQSAIRKALQQDLVAIPDWLQVDGYAFSPQHNANVKVLGLLGNIANCLLSGNTLQIPVQSLTPPTIEVNKIDLSKISHPLFAQIATEWLDDINGVEVFPEQPASYAPLPDNLNESVKLGLQKVGVEQFYSHQLQAWEQLNAGQSICITTPTASGKTNCFVPFAFHQAIEKGQTSLLIYPLRSLASDQHEKLINLNNTLAENDRLFIAKCTGDVPLETRKGYFQGARVPDILIVSPDVLHHLLYHTNSGKLQLWRDFLSRLNLIVCDESHSYVSSFGSHFANLLRRLRLACQNAENPSQLNWVISTATISNPLELASQLTGLSSEEITLINQSGAKTHERTLLVLKPQSAANFTTVNLIPSLTLSGLKGLVFVNSRKTAKQIYSLLCHFNGGTVEGIDLFYSSLSTAQRQQRIQQLATGKIQILITTSCLEAGVDLPSLDFVVLRGFSSLNSFWQRGGRCGRKSPGLIIFIPDGNSQIDFYYGSESKRLLAPVEKVKNQPNYPSIVSKHLLCAAAEGGINANEVPSFFGEKSDLIAAELLNQNQLNWSQQQILWRKGYPHKDVSLRGINDQTIHLVDCENQDVFEELTLELAHRETHKGAIYVTSDAGAIVTWRCLELNHKTHKAKLKQEDLTDRRTRPYQELIVQPEKQLDAPKIIPTSVKEGKLRLSFWWGKIGSQISGYEELLQIKQPVCINSQCSYRGIEQPSNLKHCPKCHKELGERLTIKVVDEVNFDEPLVTSYQAPILRIEVNYPLANAIQDNNQKLKESLLKTWGKPENIPSQLTTVFQKEPVRLSLHSLGHLLGKTIPLLFLASDKDVNSLTVDRIVTNGNSHPAVAYIFDSVDDGCGTTEALVNDWDACVEKALELASSCDCGDLGCPKCLTQHGCPENNEALSKLSGMWLLEQILNN